MTAFLVGTTDFQKHTSVEIKKAVNNYKAVAVKAQKGKEAVESQFTILESEKTALTTAMEEAKTAQDEAIAMVDFLKFEQEKLVRVAKEEVEEKVAKVVSERDEAIKALQKEKANWKVREATLREKTKQEAIRDILKFGMTFRRSAIFMIKEKYPDLDFSDINFTDMKGYNIPYPSDGSPPIGDLNVG